MDTLSTERRPAVRAPSRSELHPDAGGKADGFAPERGIRLAGPWEVEQRLELEVEARKNLLRRRRSNPFAQREGGRSRRREAVPRALRPPWTAVPGGARVEAEPEHATFSVSGPGGSACIRLGSCRYGWSLRCLWRPAATERRLLLARRWPALRRGRHP